MERVIDEVKRKIDIVTFTGSFVSLKKSGRNFKGLCPFHQEKTPSFVVSPDRQIWHCFGACQEGGDIIKFLMKWENITFIEALRDLAEKAGVSLRNIRFEDKLWQRKERMIGLNSLAAEFFEYVLQKTRFGERARGYLKTRALEAKIIKKFQLGYAPSSWDSLLRFLKKKKYSESEIFDSGLLVRGQSGNYYDRFRRRVIFPIKDTRGNIIGFSGRLLGETEKEAKYINTPETLLYHKRETLYGVDSAKDVIKKENNVYLVEGEFDVISSYRLGIYNMAAIKGTAVTREQLMFLKRFTNKITLALDSDTAGKEAVKKGIEEAENLEFDIAIVSIDFAKDADEAIRKDPIKFKKVIKKPVIYYDYIISQAEKNNPTDDAYGKKKFAEEVSTYIDKIKNPIVRSHYIKKIASILDVSENSIEALMRRLRRKKIQRFSFPTYKKITEEKAREKIIQKYILSLIFQNENPEKRFEEVFNIFAIEDLSVPAYQKICKLFFDYKGKGERFNLNHFLQLLPSQLKPIFDEIYLFASTELEVKNEKVEKLIYEAKRYSLKRKIAVLLSSNLEDDKEITEKLKLTNKQLTEVEKKIVTL